MRKPIPFLFVAMLACGVGLAGATDTKTYSLKDDWKPVRGHKAQITAKITNKMKMGAPGKTGPAMTSSQSYTATGEVLSVSGDTTITRWRFSEANDQTNGQTVPSRFATKPVLMTEHTRGKTEFSFEDKTSMRDDERKKLADIFGNGDDSDDEIFRPGKPVRAGESWTPSMDKLAAWIEEQGMVIAKDHKKSNVSFSLKSVRTQSDAEFGKIEGVIEVYVGGIQGVTLDPPVQMKCTVDADGCIDARLPDGTSTMTISIRGTSTVAGPQGMVLMDMDATGTRQITLKTVK